MSASSLDTTKLEREMDKTKARTFLGKRAAFYGPLMCNLTIQWDSSTQTAYTDGVTLGWNPEFYLLLPEATRETVLRHELEHVARLHNLRQGSKDPEIWNQACDHRINLDMETEGYSFVGIEWACKDQRFGTLSEEEIYIILKKEYDTKPRPVPQNDFGRDIKAGDPVAAQRSLSNVVRAIQQAKAQGAAGSIPGHLETVVDEFLSPILDWRSLLNRFFTDLGDWLYSWRRPNRRYQDMYMPAIQEDTERLEHLIYYLDISGSVLIPQIKRFNSEVKFVKERFNPARMTVVTFDTDIVDTYEFNEDDPFDKITVHNGGGTSLVCVRDHILQHKPTAAIIFTDLRCRAMKPLPTGTPTEVLWVVSGNKQATTKFGKTIHIPLENS